MTGIDRRNRFGYVRGRGGFILVNPETHFTCKRNQSSEIRNRASVCADATRIRCRLSATTITPAILASGIVVST